MDQADQKKKLDKAIEMLVELGRGNFEAQVEIDDEDDAFNIVLSGLNMLAEEFRHYRDQLESKTRLLEETLYHISEVVYAIHFDGREMDSIRFEFVSSRAMELVGFSPAELRDKASLWYRAIHPEDLHIVIETLEQLQSGAEATCEYRIKHNGTGEYVWLEDHMSSKENPGVQGVQVFCAARNVTLRKQVFKEREQLIRDLNIKYSEQMQFNYIVSHNLRSPVAGILGACELFQFPLTPQEQEETHGYIIQAAQNLDTLLKDLNKILSTKSQLHERFESFTISATIDNVRQLLEAQITEAAAELIVDIQPAGDEITSIKGYIQSILYNLISNAIKYRRENSSPTVWIDVWDENDRKFIRVRDNGIGIDLTKHGDEVFGLYRRFDNRFEGKGLGLHMTKAQVETLGGSIEVTSSAGDGTTFTIVLPR
jgi:PAS domain S-box-containing protein